MQLSPESSNGDRPLPDSGEHVWPDSGRTPPAPVRFGRISDRVRSYPAGFRPFWPDPAGSGRIPADF
jgi:hypothetical protein